MDRSPADSLNPELKATYDRIMGVTTPAPTPQPAAPAHQVAPAADVPQAAPAQSVVPPKPRTISALQPPQIHTTIDAIGVFETPIKPHHYFIIALLIGFLLLCVGGILVWLRIIAPPFKLF